jgi:predicted RNA polymerase sigma factor
MPAAVPSAIAVTQSLDAVMRKDQGRLLAILSSELRDISLAEEALQEANISALSHWGRTGLPNSPQAWLLTVARRKALDQLRKSGRDTRKAEDMAQIIEREAPETFPMNGCG